MTLRSLPPKLSAPLPVKLPTDVEDVIPEILKVPMLDTFPEAFNDPAPVRNKDAPELIVVAVADVPGV